MAKISLQNIKYLPIVKIFNSYFTVWKIQGISVTQILREIDLEEFVSSKNCSFTILEALNLAKMVNFSL